MEVYAIAVLIVAAVLFALCRGKHKAKKGEGAENTVPKGNNAETSSEKTVNVPTEFPVYWFDGNGNRVKGVAKMAQGLQVFDEKGNCIVDLNSNVAKVIGRFTTQGTSGTLTVEGGKPWAMLLQSPEAYDVIRKHGQKEHQPSVQVLTDGTIKWADCVAKQSVIVYGVY